MSITSTNIKPVDAALIRSWPLPKMDTAVDKNERGSVLIIAGSLELCGAAILCAQSALRAGAGKVTIITSAAASCLMATILPEARVIGLTDREGGGLLANPVALSALHGNQFDVLLAGPGLQDLSASRILIKHVLALIACDKVILDACAIEIVTEIAHSNCKVMITPHLGEMAHLCQTSKENVKKNLLAMSQRVASKIDGIVILKGADTYISMPEHETYLYTGGHQGLAISGSGDCLAGIAAGLVARGATFSQAAVLAVFVHGSVGSKLAERYAGVGFLASEIPAEIPRLLNGCSCGAPADDHDQYRTDPKANR